MNYCVVFNLFLTDQPIVHDLITCSVVFHSANVYFYIDVIDDISVVFLVVFLFPTMTRMILHKCPLGQPFIVLLLSTMALTNRSSVIGLPPIPVSRFARVCGLRV